MSSIPLTQLANELQAGDHELVSLVGGGGKTTTLFALGSQLVGPTILTTTTKMGAEQTSDLPVMIDPSDDELRHQLTTRSPALVWQACDDRRALGVPAASCDRWFEFAAHVVVEADGSRKRPFKAPAAHEPVIASRTTLMVACIGATAFDRPITDVCHRPDLVAALAGCAVEDSLTPERTARVLTSDAGSRKNMPSHARFAIVVHRVRPSDADTLNALEQELGGAAPVIGVRDHSIRD